MNRLPFTGLLIIVCAIHTFAQRNQGSVSVSPNNLNINTSGATATLLTYGGLTNHRPAEANWCGELISAAPAIGMKCDPATLYGSLPARFDLSRPSGNHAFTDVMSMPPAVVRKAYQTAKAGATSSFFYVRRFINTKGGPDEFVVVTCRLASGGVSVPFSLTNVELKFAVDQPILFVKSGARLPPVKAEIVYSGTGRLKGRWEIVQPGEVLPEPRDLLTEASLPVEQRAQQRRYTELQRFNVFLAPTGKYILPGPDVARVPTTVGGAYLLLLRIEAVDDKDADTNLLAVGAGPGVVHSGAVAGFPLPPLRYFVGNGNSPLVAATGSLTLLFPADNTEVARDQPLDFSWSEIGQAAYYRLEIEDLLAKPVLAALVQPGAGIYQAPPWLKDKAGSGLLRWRVVALDQSGKLLVETAWQGLRLQLNPQQPSPPSTKTPEDDGGNFTSAPKFMSHGPRYSLLVKHAETLPRLVRNSLLRVSQFSQLQGEII